MVEPFQPYTTNLIVYVFANTMTLAVKSNSKTMRTTVSNLVLVLYRLRSMATTRVLASVHLSAFICSTIATASVRFTGNSVTYLATHTT